MRRLDIALVSAYLPSRRPLSEYAWHLVQSLRDNPRVGQVHVLADRWPETRNSSDRGVMIHRCWSFSGIDQPFAVARAARRLKVDAIWFNLHLTSAGNTRASWFAGLAAPAATRIAGLPTIVTLHNMLGCTDVTWAGPETNCADRIGAHVATSLLAAGHVVCVLVPEYAALLQSRYGLRRVRVMPHGTLGSPVASPPPSDDLRLLVTFGHFGSYKRLDGLLEVMADLSASHPGIRLQVAGTDSRHTPGYLARMQERYQGLANVTFRGYVPERDVPAFFQASACVLPYATTAGASGVAMQAAMYGVPIVASDVPGFRSLARSGMRMNFYDWGSQDSLKRAILRVLSDPAAQLRDASENLTYCRRQSMNSVVDSYLDVIEGAIARTRRSGVVAERVQAPLPVAPR